MPAKRKKTTDSSNAPEPNKRVTRSSTKVNAPPKHAGPAAPEGPSTSSSNRSSTSAVSKKNAGPKQNQENERDGSEQPSKPFTTLTITHEAIKNPIPCHAYDPTSPADPTTPTLIFTHGAGGTLSVPAVENFCTGYSRFAPVFAFQGSMNLKARVKGFHACIAHISDTPSETKTLLLGGRSMGARAAVIAATEYLDAASETKAEVKLVLVSYPLKGPKDDVRDQILLDLPESVRVLFVIGDRDAMCPLDLLDAARKKMVAKSQLVVAKGADHGMHVKVNEREMGEESCLRAAEWVNGKMKVDMVEIEEG